MLMEHYFFPLSIGLTYILLFHCNLFLSSHYFLIYILPLLLLITLLLIFLGIVQENDCTGRREPYGLDFRIITCRKLTAFRCKDLLQYTERSRCPAVIGQIDSAALAELMLRIDRRSVDRTKDSRLRIRQHCSFREPDRSAHRRPAYLP